MQEGDQTTSRSRFPWIGFLASTKVTLIVIGSLILLSLIGALVPQHGMLDERGIAEWKQNHPVVSPVLAAFGLFTTFHSPLFLLALAILFLNTLACTFTSVVEDGLFSGNERLIRMRRMGFLLLHISILVCMAGGFISAAFRSSGQIILTEGQTVQDRLQNYSKLVKGPFRKEQRDQFNIELLDAQYEAPTEWSAGRKHSSVRLRADESEPCTAEIEFNRPFRFREITFTVQEIGFSPEISIASGNQKIPSFNGFIALKVWGVNKDREHRDFLPLPQSGRRLVISLLPSHSVSNGVAIKTAEKVVNPALSVHLVSPDGTETPKQVVEPGKRAVLDELSIGFGELRHWASFLVVQDPGYPIVCMSFWMAISALFLRYAPDIMEWIEEVKQNGTD
jgi:cytochrome c biogenesis protein ResB